MYGNAEKVLTLPAKILEEERMTRCTGCHCLTLSFSKSARLSHSIHWMLQRFHKPIAREELMKTNSKSKHLSFGLRLLWDLELVASHRNFWRRAPGWTLFFHRMIQGESWWVDSRTLLLLLRFISGQIMAVLATDKSTGRNNVVFQKSVPRARQLSVHRKQLSNPEAVIVEMRAI